MIRAARFTRQGADVAINVMTTNVALLFEVGLSVGKHMEIKTQITGGVLWCSQAMWVP